MKKQWTESAFKHRNRLGAAASVERRTTWKKRRRDARREGQFTPALAEIIPKTHRSPLVFKAPAVLSLIDSPDLAIEFFRLLQQHRKRRDVFVDLSDVDQITPDAIAMLIALVGFLGKRRSVLVSGNYPEGLRAKNAIRRSGFDKYIRSRLAPDGTRQGEILRDDYSINQTHADGEYAAKLVDFASEGRDGLGVLQVTYGHLIECMGNTHQHAGGGVAGAERWWASVYRDAERHRDCFTFVDMGVGIFRSVELGVRLKMYNLFDALRPSILRKLLQGEIPSSTGKGYRGRGLPSNI
jgi:hypothetical protein